MSPPRALRCNALRLGTALACLLTAPCTKNAAQLVVLVDSDLDDGALDRIRGTVKNAKGEVTSEHDFDLHTIGLPLSFGVELKGSDPNQPVTVEIAGYGPSNKDLPLVVRRATTSFISGKMLLLTMFLAKGCANATCDPDQTCSETSDGRCESSARPASQLQPITPGMERRAHDAGVGPHPDASASDTGAGLDAGDAAGLDGARPPCSTHHTVRDCDLAGCAWYDCAIGHECHSRAEPGCAICPQRFGVCTQDCGVRQDADVSGDAGPGCHQYNGNVTACNGAHCAYYYCDPGNECHSRIELGCAICPEEYGDCSRICAGGS